jgi:hypothetical protein
MSTLLLVLPAAILAGLARWLLGAYFGWTMLGLLAASVIATNVWWWRKQKGVNLEDHP